MAPLTRFFHPVLAARALRKRPVRVVIAGERFALWRDAAGVACAVADACPHRNAPLSLGRVRRDGRLACGYHGWNFDGEGNGACPSQPKLVCSTRSFRVVERAGYLWLGDAHAEDRPFPMPELPGFELAGAFSTLFEAPLHIALDNFSEHEHFPSVHVSLGWREEDWPSVHYEARSDGDESGAVYIGPQRPSLLMPLVGLRKGDLFHAEFESRFDPLRMLYTSFWTDAARTVRRPIEGKTLVFMVPETATTTRFHTFAYVKIAPRSWFRFARPLVSRIATAFVRFEWWMDARRMKALADTAPDLRGLRLGKFDEAVIKNRKLLRSVYYGERP